MSRIEVWVYQPQTQTFTHQPAVAGTATQDDITGQIGGVAYTTFRTYHHNGVMRFHSHFTRLEESCALLGKPLTLDVTGVKQALRAAADDHGAGDLRIRLITGCPRNWDDVYILIDTLATPAPEDYARGVAASTFHYHRENPLAKSTAFIQLSEQFRQEIARRGLQEGLMISPEGKILEGLSSNFFGVVDGVVYTADEGVLRGITRSLTLDAIQALGIPHQLAALEAEHVSRLEEAFITSTSRSVLPVTRIDDAPVGSGAPGEITRKVMAKFSELVESELEYF